jgi:hypothetical protein
MNKRCYSEGLSLQVLLSLGCSMMIHVIHLCLISLFLHQHLPPPHCTQHPALPHSPDHAPDSPSKWVWVDEVGDDSDQVNKVINCHRWVQVFDGAAALLWDSKTLFENMQGRQEALQKPLMAPFSNEDEWDLAKWLKNSTQTATEKFYKTKGVHCNLTAINISWPTHNIHVLCINQVF